MAGVQWANAIIVNIDSGVIQIGNSRREFDCSLCCVRANWTKDRAAGRRVREGRMDRNWCRILANGRRKRRRLVRDGWLPEMLDKNLIRFSPA